MGVVLFFVFFPSSILMDHGTRISICLCGAESLLVRCFETRISICLRLKISTKTTNEGDTYEKYPFIQNFCCLFFHLSTFSFCFFLFFGFVLFDFVRFGITHKKHFDPDSGSVFFSPQCGGRRAISLMSL